MKTDKDYRRACHCDDCRKGRSVLALLDSIATSDCLVGAVDIELSFFDRLSKARQILAGIVGATYHEDTNRHD
jgi:hypothetical protein